MVPSLIPGFKCHVSWQVRGPARTSSVISGLVSLTTFWSFHLDVNRPQSKPSTPWGNLSPPCAEALSTILPSIYTGLVTGVFTHSLLSHIPLAHSSNSTLEIFPDSKYSSPLLQLPPSVQGLDYFNMPKLSSLLQLLLSYLCLLTKANVPFKTWALNPPPQKPGMPFNPE